MFDKTNKPIHRAINLVLLTLILVIIIIVTNFIYVLCISEVVKCLIRHEGR